MDDAAKKELYSASFIQENHFFDLREGGKSSQTSGSQMERRIIYLVQTEVVACRDSSYFNKNFYNVIIELW